MPRVRRKPRQRRSSGWTEAHRRQLLSGHSFNSIEEDFGKPADVDAMREAWEELRDELLADWVREKPLTRPWSWWRFDALERRRRVDGKPHPFDSPERKKHNAQFAHVEDMDALWYGEPQHLCVEDDDQAIYETEPEYLHRLGFLTSEEQTAFNSLSADAPAYYLGQCEGADAAKADQLAEEDRQAPIATLDDEALERRFDESRSTRLSFTTKVGRQFATARQAVIATEIVARELEVDYEIWSSACDLWAMDRTL